MQNRLLTHRFAVCSTNKHAGLVHVAVVDVVDVIHRRVVPPAI